MSGIVTEQTYRDMAEELKEDLAELFKEELEWAYYINYDQETPM